MADIFRESAMGQLIRFITRDRVLRYPEEMPDYQLPEAYNTVLNTTTSNEKSLSRSSSDLDGKENTTIDPQGDALTKEKTVTSKRNSGDLENVTLTRTRTREHTQGFTEQRLEVEEELALERTKTIPIAPTKTKDGYILVDWYTTDDPANPQNWSVWKKHFVAFIIGIYTFAVYCSSAIYTPGEEQVIKEFGVTPEVASLPLSLYVLAYGLGPLFFAPMSEVPLIGRNPVYISSMCLFVLISVGPPLVKSYAGLLVLRFLQGFFGSPCLANGGATMQDLYSLLYLPYALATWVSAAYCGPALGPLISGFAVTAKGWRWAFWEILWLGGPVFIIMFLLLPETSTPNILLRRAKRLRKLTGDHRIKSQSEIDQAGMEPSKVLIDALIKPLEITIKDPAIAFVNGYTALVYGIYYSFFEVFPLVYPVYYHMSIGIVGVVFTCILVSCLIGIAIYSLYLHFYLIPDIMKRGLRAQEHRLVPAIFGAFGPPIGLFIFAWTARADIPWIASVIGITIYGASVFIVMQAIFVYVPLSYPQYAASLFAGNDFFRSALACGSIMFARPLFINLGVDKGVTLLACLSTLGVVGILVLYYKGASLRKRSRFAVADN